MNESQDPLGRAPLGRTRSLPAEAPFQHSPTFPFEVEKLLGVGGYGQVFKARDPALDRPVAIKALRPELLTGPEAATLRRRFLQEARAAATLVHPGIATVYSVGEHEGRPFLAMEYLDGEDLESYSARRGRLRTAEVADIGLQLLDALGAAHRAGVVHRDIKPSNLMLLADGTVKVMDFGIARVAGKELVKTQAGSLIATPQFASPEQLSGESVDERSDLYSVAVVIYHLLARAYPHPADSLAKLFHRVMYEQPLPLSEHGVYCTPDWQVFLERGLAKARDRRFPDAATMARELLSVEPALPTGSGQHDAAPPEPQPETLPLAAPDSAGVRSLHAVAAAKEPEGLVRSWLDTFTARDLGRVGPTTVLPRLLDVPLHAEPFVGALALGREDQTTVLLLAGGQILAASDPLGEESELLERDAVEHLLLTPGDQTAALVEPVASFLRAWRAGEEPDQQSLEASYVDLPRLLQGLDDGPHSWVVQLESAASSALLVVQDDGIDALVGGEWAERFEGSQPTPAEWGSWLGTLDAKITLWRTVARPDETWYRLAFAGTQLRVEGAPKLGAALASTPPPGRAAAADVAGSLEISAGTDSQSGLALRALAAPAGQALRWLLRTLPEALALGERRREWKYLAQWIPEVARATLYERLGSEGLFDAVTYDAQGKILHLVVVARRIDAAFLRRLTDRVAALKTEREKRGDVGAVVLVAQEIERDAAEAYGELLYSGRSNKWFGLDQSLGYHGFVRLSARRGYHLLLARASDAIEDAEALWELGGGETA